MARAQPSLPAAARKALLEWYRPRARAYPWRRGRPNAYRTLVSELMLQQTQAPRVVPIFEAFVGVFPTVRALAGASRADVLRAWAGLGYNRRAVSLHRAAQAVVAQHGGRVPTDRADLQRLPGVGPYTAAAIASIAGGEPVAAIDVNARRIVARVAYGRDAASVSTGDIDATAATWVDRTRPRRLEPGVDGSRQGALPGGPALRRVPARGRLPIRPGLAARRCRPPGGSPGSRDRYVRSAAGWSTCCAHDRRPVSPVSRGAPGSQPIGSRRRSVGWSATGWFGAPGARIGSRTDASGPIYGVR